MSPGRQRRANYLLTQRQSPVVKIIHQEANGIVQTLDQGELRSIDKGSVEDEVTKIWCRAKALRFLQSADAVADRLIPILMDKQGISGLMRDHRPRRHLVFCQVGQPHVRLRKDAPGKGQEQAEILLR